VAGIIIGQRINTIADFSELRVLTGSGRGWRCIHAAGATTHGNFIIQGTTDGFASSFINGLVITPTGNVGTAGATPTVAMHANGAIRHATYTVATLPAAATVGAGSRAAVSDANATTFNAIVAGGGANFVPVISDGTNWRIG
jgi:hypothetical protein